ncbi:MAG: molybdopterin-dependent oxidoreductase [Vampirovibrionales bacterium]
MLPLTDLPISFAHAWHSLPTQQPAQVPWPLALDGVVEHPQTLSYQHLLHCPQAYQPRRIVSADGWTYKTGWHGVLLKQLLARVSVAQQCQYVRQVNRHGHEQLLPLKELLDNDALLITHLEQEPLHPAYGGPVRLVSFSHVWEASVPQLTRLEFVSKATKEEQAQMEGLRIQPSKVYAYDLKALKSIEKPGEVKTF